MEIIWGRLAHKSIIETLSFLSEEWGEQVAKRLWKNTLKSIEMLKSFPKIGQVCLVIDRYDIIIRELMIDKYNKIIYYNRNDSIYIIIIWNTQKDPALLRDIINNGLNK